MDDLNKIISKNAQVAIRRADKRARELGTERVTTAEVARRMVRRLHPDIDEHDEPDDFQAKADSIARTLRLYSKNKQRWNASHIEAFCDSVGTHPVRLVSRDYDAGKVPEADRAEFLSRALGRRLQPKEVSDLISSLSQQLERPGLYELVQTIASVLLTAEDRHEAATTVSHLIVESAALKPKTAKKRRSAIRR